MPLGVDPTQLCLALLLFLYIIAVCHILDSSLIYPDRRQPLLGSLPVGLCYILLYYLSHIHT